MVRVLVFVDSGEGLQLVPPEQLDLAFEDLLSSKVLIPLWNAHSLLLLCGYLSRPSLKERLCGLEAVADDTLGGQLTRHIYRRIGLTGRRLSLASQEDRLSDLRDILLQNPSMVMAADSHGPYRTINSGFARLVRQYCGAVRPIAAVCTRSFPVFRRVKMALPLPGGLIVIGVGEAISKGRESQSVTSTRQIVQASLSCLEAKLTQLALNHNHG